MAGAASPVQAVIVNDRQNRENYLSETQLKEITL